VIAAIDATALTPQPLAVEEMRPGEVDGHAGSAESVDRLQMEALGTRAVHAQRRRARPDPEGPVGPGHPGHFIETLQRVLGEPRSPGSSGGLDQLDHAPV